MTDIDVTKIQPGDQVKLQVFLNDLGWTNVKGWHTVRRNALGALLANGRTILHVNGRTPLGVRVRAFRPAPEMEQKVQPVPIPTELGTRFTATVRGEPNHIVFVIVQYVTAYPAGGTMWHRPRDITNITCIERP